MRLAGFKSRFKAHLSVFRSRPVSLEAEAVFVPPLLSAGRNKTVFQNFTEAPPICRSDIFHGIRG
jgi:hypothetical protein